MHSKICTFLILNFCCTLSLFSQVQGLINDENGEPLAFASIYVEGTTLGTNSNAEGVYALQLDPGVYTVVFSYLGYRSVYKTIELGEETLDLNIQLEPESIKLSTVEVDASAEDPAYPIIRKAIEKRKYYRNLVPSYACDTYVKGMIKFLDAPDKILGKEIGNMEGALDSNRQGIFYLSESESKYYVEEPSKQKEVMYSSKVSGDDQGFGFNRASTMDFNLYDSYLEFNRKIVSPIANSAFLYYKYRLIGTIFDEAGRLINKIQVIPRREEDAACSGFIYIVEDLWNIQSCKLHFTGASLKMPVFDTLTINQLHVPVKEPDVWRMLSQSISFKAGMFGFKVGGKFTGVFKNYNLTPNFDKKFFNNEIFKVEEEANQKDSTYWEDIRPIPLTIEQVKDYKVKDSLQVVKKSPSYRDSVDKVNNKFAFGDLLFGYSWERSYNRQRFEWPSLFEMLQFNTVQGMVLNAALDYQKRFDDEFIRWFQIEPILNYGFAEKKFRAYLKARYNFDRIYHSRLSLQGGTQIRQFNGSMPISNLWNSSYTLFERKNFAKYYEQTFASLSFEREIFNGLRGYFSVGYADRSPLNNNSDYSFFKRDRIFTSNDPLNATQEGSLSFTEHKVLEFDLKFRLRIGSKYMLYPGKKFNMGSKFPDIWLQYKHKRYFDAQYDDLHFIGLSIEEDDVSLGLLGYSAFRARLGSYMKTGENIPFTDYKHFDGTQIPFLSVNDYLNHFLLLPYYAYSTNEDYLSLHWQHSFDGFILDKIPLIRKLGWSITTTAAYLKSGQLDDYFEWSVGLDNIGFKAIRNIRVDFVMAHGLEDKPKTAYRIGIGF